MNVETSVRGFLQESAGGRQRADISSDESLLDSGILDSASILELVAFLESRFGIVIPDEELLPQNFETIDAIVELVETKGGSGSTDDAAS